MAMTADSLRDLPSDSPQQSPDHWVQVARIVGAHGVQGGLKLKTADAQPDWARQLKTLWLVPSNPVLKKDWPQGVSRTVRQNKAMADYRWLLQLDGVDTRNDAELWTGTEVWVPRAAIPAVAETDTFRTYELVGLKVISKPEKAPEISWGKVSAVQYSTGQDFLEILLRPAGKTVMIPFQTVFFPTVDIAAGWIEIAGLDDFLTDAMTTASNASPAD